MTQKWMDNFDLNSCLRVINFGEYSRLDDTFFWKHSQEGEGYWMEIYNRGMTPQAYLRLVQMVKEFKEVKNNELHRR